MTVAKLESPEAKIGQFCRRNGIRKLALFGSVLADRFSDSSDIDVLRSLHAEVGSDGLHRVCIELAWTEPGWTAAKPISIPVSASHK